MSRNLLILSAGLVESEMQSNFGELPSCMIPLQGRTALDFIYHENVNHHAQIYLTLGKQAEFVTEYLNHSQYKIQPVILNESKSLLHSLCLALGDINKSKPLTIVFGDTYLPFAPSLFNDLDAVVYSYSDDSERWTLAEVVNDKIEFLDKVKVEDKSNYKAVIGVFHITDPEGLLEHASKCLSDDRGFYDAMERYLNERKFAFIHTDRWIDYGHTDLYFDLKKTVEARSFNHISIDTKSRKLRKTSSYSSKFINEISWAVNLPDELRGFIPEIFEFSLKDPAYIEMQYVNFLTLHEVFVFGNLSPVRWKEILEKLRNVNEEFKKFTFTDPVLMSEAARDMYLAKTRQRLEEFRSRQLFDFGSPLTINGVEYHSLDYYIERLEQVISGSGILQVEHQNIIHGDFCLSNILYDLKSDKVLLIDPRGSFGDIRMYGDNLYEWAKLAHSIDGYYDFIISDTFSIVRDKNNIAYRIHSKGFHEEVRKYFYNDIIPAEDAQKIRLIQSLLFFSMLPLHADSPRRQSVMLCRAIEMFHPFTKVTE